MPTHTTPPKSQGHARFIGAFEYFYGADGDLYRARIDLPVQPDGRRCGRWEAPAWLAEDTLALAQQAAVEQAQADAIETNTAAEASHEWHLALALHTARTTCAVCSQACYPAVAFNGQPLCAACAARAAAYDDRRDARIERLAARADQQATDARATWDRAHDMASIIPFGQPILVGHHSERRDRNYRARIENTHRRAYEKTQDAKRTRQRAEAAAANTAISSDDPLAVLKLQEQLDEAERKQDLMKAVNKTVRQLVKQDVSDAEAAARLAEGHNLHPAQAARVWEADYAGRRGFPAFMLRNNNANIRRLRQRITDLQARAEQVAAARAQGEVVSEEEVLPGITVERDRADNRLRLRFPAKPGADVRAVLKSNGFRWSRANMAWQRHLTPKAEHALTRVLDALRAAH